MSLFPSSLMLSFDVLWSSIRGGRGEGEEGRGKWREGEGNRRKGEENGGPEEGRGKWRAGGRETGTGGREREMKGGREGEGWKGGKNG